MTFLELLGVIAPLVALSHFVATALGVSEPRESDGAPISAPEDAPAVVLTPLGRGPKWADDRVRALPVCGSTSAA